MIDYSTKVGERIFLRYIEEMDLPLMFSWRINPNIGKWFDTELTSFKEHLEWYKKYLNENKTTEYFYMIIDKDTGFPIGQISLYNVDQEKKTAEFGRLIIAFPDYLGKGYAKEASKIALQFAFETLKLEQVHLEVKATNHTAKKLYDSLGFKSTGINKSHIFMEIKNVK